MKKFLLALVLMTGVVTLPTQAVEPPSSQQYGSWKLAAKCSSYNRACDVADRLEDNGYCTKITKESNNCYCVWCK